MVVGFERVFFNEDDHSAFRPEGETDLIQVKRKTPAKPFVPGRLCPCPIHADLSSLRFRKRGRCGKGAKRKMGVKVEGMGASFPNAVFSGYREGPGRFRGGSGQITAVHEELFGFKVSQFLRRRFESGWVIFEGRPEIQGILAL